MANVANSFTLPAQPATTGTVERVALGGDGFTEPSAMYVIRNADVDGDASGIGHLSVNITMDDNFCSMLGYATFLLEQATPVDDIIYMQLAGPTIATQAKVFDAKLVAFLQSGLDGTWLPPATVQGGPDPATLSVFADNLADDTLTFNANIFLFDIRAREAAIWSRLVAARGGV